jgi:hypothetical protein
MIWLVKKSDIRFKLNQMLNWFNQIQACLYFYNEPFLSWLGAAFWVCLREPFELVREIFYLMSLFQIFVQIKLMDVTLTQRTVLNMSPVLMKHYSLWDVPEFSDLTKTPEVATGNIMSFVIFSSIIFYRFRLFNFRLKVSNSDLFNDIHMCFMELWYKMAGLL